MFEETTGTLFCSDILHQQGRCDPITSSDVLWPRQPAAMIGRQLLHLLAQDLHEHQLCQPSQHGRIAGRAILASLIVNFSVVLGQLPDPCGTWAG